MLVYFNQYQEEALKSVLDKSVSGTESLEWNGYAVFVD